MEAEVMENYNIMNPIDAYLMKPFIGYLAQDFGNVWMNMNCINNVFFSLVIRTFN
jgi:hypothetical protein